MYLHSVRKGIVSTRRTHCKSVVAEEHIPCHGLSEAGLVLLGTCHRRPVSATTRESAILDPTLKLLVPRVGSDTVDDTDNEFFSGLIHRDHKRVVHDVLSCQEKRIVPD